MNLILLGAPGCGKGTQAERIVAAHGLVHVASGDLFRDHVQRDSPLGREAACYMHRGELVPDEITVAMIQERLEQSDTERGVLLDGFPRTLVQADALERIMTERGRRIDGLVFIDVPDEDIVDRLAGRLVCRECHGSFHVTAHPFRECPHGKCHGEHLYRREDDNPDTVRKRLRTFYARTGPLIERWQDQGRLILIPGVGSVEEVTQATLNAVQRIARR